MYEAFQQPFFYEGKVFKLEKRERHYKKTKPSVKNLQENNYERGIYFLQCLSNPSEIVPRLLKTTTITKL